MITVNEIQGTEREFLDIFKTLCYSRNSWQVWGDLIEAFACSLANCVDKNTSYYTERENRYAKCIERLGSVEVPAKLFAVVVMAIEKNPKQDFLGKMFMELNLGNNWKGQFFTPYSVCEMMAGCTIGNVDAEISEKGFISICDPACGAGATLIAAANKLKQSKYNFQNHVLFVGQDIDRIAAQMCYIQLSLLGCAGYVCVANTLTIPITGPVLFPNEGDGQEFWYTPMFFNKVWNTRRMFKLLSGRNAAKKEDVNKKYFYFFDYKEVQNDN